MKVSGKEVRVVLRDLENISDDLVNSSLESYLSLIERFVSFMSDNSIINQIVSPLLHSTKDYSKYIKEFGNGWGELIIPPKIEDHISMLLKLFDDFLDGRKKILDFILTFYGSSRISDSLYNFNTAFVEPALREIINKIEDYLDNLLDDDQIIETSSLQIFSIGNIHNVSGNLAIGQNIEIKSINNYEKLTDEFLKTILNLGYSYNDFKKIEQDIELLKEEVLKESPDADIISKSFDKIKKIGGKVFVEILVKLISNPIVNSIASNFL